MALLVAAAAPARAAPPRDMGGRIDHVLLVVIDTLRADRLGLDGYPRETSPFLDDLGAKGTAFERAYAPGNWTASSVASLFTSSFPSVHGVGIRDERVDEVGSLTRTTLHGFGTTLAESFRSAGWRTIGIAFNQQLVPAMGFDRGFDHFTNDVGDGAIPGHFLELVRRERPARSFAYLHFLGPHWPYATKESLLAPFGGDFYDVALRFEGRELFAALRAGTRDLTPRERELLDASYDAKIRMTDRALGNLWRRLRRSGWPRDRTLLVVTSDHGEELLDRGSMGHGQHLHDELIRVPLVLHGPGIPRGRRVRAPVSLVDLMPTLLGLAGIEAPPGLMGRDLGPRYLRPAAPPATAEGLARTEMAGARAFTGDAYRYVRTLDDATGRTKGEQLFHLASDPDEERDLVTDPAHREALVRLRAAATAELVRPGPARMGGEAEPARATLGADEVERLRELGYFQ